MGSLSAPSLVPKPASGSTGDDPVDHDPVGHDSVGHDSVDAGPIDEESRFRSVFDETYRPLVAYARRRTTDWSEADDIVAEAFSVAWRRRAELPADNPLPWLYAVAANVLRNHRRATSRRLRLVDKIEAQPNPAPAPDPADLEGTSMRRALASLSDDDQEVLRLVAWEGLSHAEVGVVLDCSTNAVGIRIHRARQRLLTALDEEPNQ